MRQIFILAGTVVALPALGNDGLLHLPLEDLMKIEISSASRKVQQVQQVPAAVFVISRDDIERSGARSIPEALRMAPGVEVARVGNNSWAVSIRGFNGRFANKLLVLKDGRNIYSPLYAGVLWEAEDAVLGDIERIEVIRGPNAAMWGANAVNGVINIISRHAGETQGTDVIVATGTDEPASLTLRHGFQVGDGYWRLSGKGFDQSPGSTRNGEPGKDNWTAGRLGLRGDWSAQEGGHWMLVGEAYQSRSGNRLDMSGFGAAGVFQDILQDNRGGNLLLRREQPTADGGQLDWQVSAEGTVLNLQTFIREDRKTLAGEFQRRMPVEAHDVLWGASCRVSRDQLALPASAIPQGMTFDQTQRDSRSFSVFAHDDFALIPDVLHLSGGVRFGYDSWSGSQAQPDLRLAWMPNAQTTWWSSLARAARTPSRLELDGLYSMGETPANPPLTPAVRLLRLAPAPDTLKAEVVTALEAGFKRQVNARLSVDASVFVSDYAGLVSMTSGLPQVTSPTLVTLPFSSNNDASARTRGFEVAADWQVSHHWRVQSHYTRLYLDSPRLSDPATVLMQDQLEGRVASHRASLRSSWTLDDGAQFDLWLKYTSRLSSPDVAAYTVLDLRYAFRIGRQAEISIVGQNLLGQHHVEFISDYLPIQQSDIGRNVLIKGTWHF